MLRVAISAKSKVVGNVSRILSIFVSPMNQSRIFWISLNPTVRAGTGGSKASSQPIVEASIANSFGFPGPMFFSDVIFQAFDCFLTMLGMERRIYSGFGTEAGKLCFRDRNSAIIRTKVSRLNSRGRLRSGFLAGIAFNDDRHIRKLYGI
jgi:hypothetical protein